MRNAFIRSRTRLIPRVLIALAAGVPSLWGCASDDGTSSSSTRVLTPADFKSEAVATDSTAKPTKSSAPARPVQAPARGPETTGSGTLAIGARGLEPVVADDPAADIVATPGTPTAVDGARPIDHAIIVDSLVGQINGRPVFASEILEPLHARLTALADQTKTRADFRNSALRVISEELRRRIEEELALSEARASLTPEQRTGLFYFLGEIKSGLVSQQKGSEVAADEALRQGQGRSLEAQAKQVLDKELIQNELRQRVMPRVQVPWRDVQQEYERQYDRYHPKPTARLRMILVSGLPDDPSYRERVQTVTEALAAESSFEALASRPPNEFLRSIGGLIERKFDGEYSEGTYSPIAEVNGAARQLAVQHWAGPIVYSDRGDRRERTAWIYLDSIDRPAAITLEQAQLEIERELTERRLQRELAKYLNGLSSRGNVSDIKEMTESLTDIATERYVPPSRK